MAVLFGSIAFCAFSNDARAWGIELTVSVTPTEFTQNVETQVTVTVTDSSGLPVNGANVIMYYVDMDTVNGNPGMWSDYNAPVPGPSSYSFPGGSGITGADGTWTTTFTPEYGSGSVHLFIQASNGSTESGYAEFEIQDDPNPGDDSIINKIMNAIGRGIAAGIVMFIVLIITAAGWYGSTKAVKKRFESAKLAGFNKKVEDNNSKDDPLKHPDRNSIFKSFKEGLRETKESKLFITNRLLRSFVIDTVNLHYAGIVRGDEEVEYPSTDVKEQRVSEAFKLHTDPKPTPPTKFVDEAQHYPISEKVDTCSRCSGTGTNKCEPCKGSGKIPCDKCGASGRTLCYGCNGAGYKEGVGAGTTTITVDSSGHQTGWATQSAGATTRTTCGTCNGSRYVACGKCGGTTKIECKPCQGTGSITCVLCKGDKETRHLTRKVWTYKHESFRKVHGPEELKAGADRYEEISDTLQPGPSLDDTSSANYSAEASAATPKIKAIVDNARNSYKSWKGRTKGKVVLDKHDMIISPVTGLDVGYPAKKEDKTFKVWALGNPKAYVLDAGETPTKLTARYAARHAAYAVVMLLEIAFFVYAIMEWHILG